MRQEYRRLRAMHAYEESSQSAQQSKATEVELADAYPEIDEAIAKLSEKERNALMLRFHVGLGFREMGMRLGKTEDACRKQVSRALEHLATVLRKQGTSATVTVAALTAGLPIMFGKASAAKVSAQAICQSALAHVGNPTTLSTITNLVMSNIKTKAIVAAAVYLTLAGTSFVTGRHVAASSLSDRSKHPAELSQESPMSRATMLSPAPPSTRSVSDNRSIIQQAADLMRTARQCCCGCKRHAHVRRS